MAACSAYLPLHEMRIFTDGLEMAVVPTLLEILERRDQRFSAYK
jgi:hypothetical protein